MTGAAATLDRSGPAYVIRTPGPFSFLIRRRALLATVALLLILGALFLAALAVGTRLIPLDEVLRGVVGDADRATTLTMQQFRLPRAIVAVLVGAALGLSGAIVQALTRNPIASPDVLGVTAGASFGAVTVLLLLGGNTVGYGGAAAELSQVGLPVGAIVGAFLAGGLVLWFAAAPTGGGLRFGGHPVVLAGIVLHAAFIGLVHWGLTRGDVDQAAKAAVWLLGSLHGRGWEHVSALAVAAAVLFPVTLVLSRRLNVLLLGDDVAATLGVRVGPTRMALLCVAFALAGTAAAAAGPVDFVALLAPQIARRIVRGPGVPMVAAAIVGAGLLLAADLIARFVVPGTELPAGAVTALVGAPYLLLLVARSGGRT